MFGYVVERTPHRLVSPGRSPSSVKVVSHVSHVLSQRLRVRSCLNREIALRTALVGILIALTVAGCTSDGGIGEPDGATSEADDAGSVAASCSTGPVYDASTEFPQKRRQDAGVACTPHCGQDEHGAWALNSGPQLYRIGALPSGACAPGTPPCDLNIGRDCGDRPYAIWLSFFCECASGSWSCSGSYEGGGACPLAK